jgi:hypothetical protein
MLSINMTADQRDYVRNVVVCSIVVNRFPVRNCQGPETASKDRAPDAPDDRVRSYRDQRPITSIPNANLVRITKNGSMDNGVDVFHCLLIPLIPRLLQLPNRGREEPGGVS